MHCPPDVYYQLQRIFEKKANHQTRKKLSTKFDVKKQQILGEDPFFLHQKLAKKGC